MNLVERLEKAADAHYEADNALRMAAARIRELEEALRLIELGAKRYWREGEDAYQFAIIAGNALASQSDRGEENEPR